MSTLPQAIAPAQPACPRCAHPGAHVRGPGSGPHAARLLCAACGAFIKWLSTHDPQEREARRESARRQWMAQQPATARQLSYLKKLGYHGPAPRSRLEAHDLIMACLQHREVES
jgi:hypothetical protein